MDQITIKTPNPKCRLQWCLIKFKDWRYSQSYWYFLPLFLTGSSTPPPTFPCENKYRGMYLYTVYLTRIRTYTIALPPQGASDRLTPAARSLYKSIFKKSRHLGFGVFPDIWSREEMISCWKIPVHCSNENRAYSCPFLQYCAIIL